MKWQTGDDLLCAEKLAHPGRREKHDKDLRNCSVWLWDTGVGHGEGIAAEDTVSRKVTLCDVAAFKQKWPQQRQRPVQTREQILAT